jgi:hypothetical protein
MQMQLPQFSAAWCRLHQLMAHYLVSHAKEGDRGSTHLQTLMAAMADCQSHLGAVLTLKEGDQGRRSSRVAVQERIVLLEVNN